jgi:hypothetical protein
MLVGTYFRPQKNEILEQYHVLVYQVWPIIAKKV